MAAAARAVLRVRAPLQREICDDEGVQVQPPRAAALPSIPRGAQRPERVHCAQRAVPDLRGTQFQGNLFNPATLPPARQTAAASGGELPYVLYLEKGDLEQNATFREDESDLY